MCTIISTIFVNYVPRETSNNIIIVQFFTFYNNVSRETLLLWNIQKKHICLTFFTVFSFLSSFIMIYITNFNKL